MACTEKFLGVVDSSAGHRVLLMLRERHPKPFELRTESFAPDVGWYTQQSLELTRAELSGLKNLLGVPLSRACSNTWQELQPADRSESGQSILSFAAAARTA